MDVGINFVNGAKVSQNFLLVTVSLDGGEKIRTHSGQVPKYPIKGNFIIISLLAKLRVTSHMVVSH